MTLIHSYMYQVSAHSLYSVNSKSFVRKKRIPTSELLLCKAIEKIGGLIWRSNKIITPKKRWILFSLFGIFLAELGYSQVYIERQTRHRFAQLNIGLDVEMNFGGTTKYLDAQNVLAEYDLASTFRPRFVIGGTHFWGHADFYIAIPLLYPQVETAAQEIQYLRGVETVFKYYPWRIEHHKLRPYLGCSIAPFYFEQRNTNLQFGNGPELSQTSFPFLFGFTYQQNNQLFELGMAWNYANQQEYYVSRELKETIETPPIYLNLSYRYILETTLGAEKSWESGRTAEVTEALAQQKRLNSFYVGLGLSSAFWQGSSSYNESVRPFINDYGISIMPDVCLGYYWHQPDLNLTVGYRGYKTSANTYGAIQSLKRKSVVLELTKYLFDYHGFVPFIGPALSYESLAFQELFEGTEIHDLVENKMSYGLTFGWDIRPNRLQSWILRTNLRWFPDLNITLDGDKQINFNNIEFNFIQMIIYPSRMIKHKK